MSNIGSTEVIEISDIERDLQEILNQIDELKIEAAGCRHILKKYSQGSYKSSQSVTSTVTREYEGFTLLAATEAFLHTNRGASFTLKEIEKGIRQGGLTTRAKNLQPRIHKVCGDLVKSATIFSRKIGGRNTYTYENNGELE